MSESVGTIYYEVEADTAKLLTSGKQVDVALNGMQAQFSKTDKAANASQFQMTKTASAVQELGRQAQAAQNPLGGLTKMLGGLLTLQGANSLIQMAEAYNEMAERVRMATRSTDEYELVQQRLLATSNGTYRALSEAQEVFISTGDNLRDMGYSLEQALDITDSLSYSFVRNATATDRAQNALRAYDMALNKGKVDANGWLTIVGAIPSVANDIAAATGKSAQQIREMGASGKITAGMLNDGLLQSLDANKKAADGMATTLKDAFTTLRNNLSAYVGEANQATGVTAVMASAVKGLGENIDVVANLLLVAGVGALARFITTTGAATLAMIKSTMAVRAKAAENLRVAKTEAAAAIAAAEHAAANVGLVGGVGSATAALHAKDAALKKLVISQGAARAAGIGLLGILGGPAGIVALAASAAAGIYLFGNRSSDAAPKVDLLTASVKELGDANLKLMRTELMKKVSEMTAFDSASGKANARIETLNNNLRQFPGHKNAKEWREEVERLEASTENESSALGKLRDQLEKVNDEISGRSGKTGGRVEQKDPEVAKRLQGMRDELELAKLTGAARAKLQALQKLGENATAEERAEAEKLAATIYSLEQAQKSAGEATKGASSSAKENAKALEKMANELNRAALSGEELAAAAAKDSLNKFATPDQIARAEQLGAAMFRMKELTKDTETIQNLANQLALASMSGQDLAEAQAVLSLGAYATPEQVETVRQLSAMLFQVERQKALLNKVGGEGASPLEVNKFITGDVQPLSGGPFDNQTARYDAEAKAEEERYAAQLERMTTAFEAQKLKQEEYNAIFEDLQRTHSDRMTQIEQAKAHVQLSAMEAGFGDAASAMKSAFGEQSGLYKAAFVAQKAAAIAQSIVAIQAGIAQASASGPFPANLAAMATVAAQTASIIGTISSTNISGGRQYGGPVAGGKMYRINETGAPEVLNMANGQQFMLPNGRGEVVSNKDATQSGKVMQPQIVVQLVESPDRGGQVEQIPDDQGGGIRAFVAQIRRGGEAAQVLESTYGLSRRGR